MTAPGEVPAALAELGGRLGVTRPGASAASAHLWAWVGKTDEARAEADRVRADGELKGDPASIAAAEAVLAILDARAGDIDAALSRWDAAQRQLPPVAAAHVLLDAAEALLDRESPADVSAAASRLASARDALGKVGEKEAPLLRLSLRIELARARAGSGDLEGAIQELVAVAEAARGKDGAEIAFRAHAAHATLLEQKGERGKDAWGRALERLEDVTTALPRELRESFLAVPRRAEVKARASGKSARKSEPGEGSRDGRWARLVEITKRLATERDPARLLDRINESAVDLSGAERGYVLLVEEGKLVPHAVRDARQPDDPHVAFSQSIAEAVLIDKEPIVTVDARADGRLSEYLSVHKLMLQSVACLPIRAGDHTLGVLYVENRVRKGRFGQSDVELLQAFADQCAIALENARLLSEIQAKNVELDHRAEELAKAKDQIERLLTTTTAERDDARAELVRAREALGQKVRQGIVGESPAIRKVLSVIERVRDAGVPVVIFGESGTGKELVARAIHHGSSRARQPFVALNCAAIPETLLESELFGHERGAFTGAEKSRHGVFVRANGGTLFLDEIGDMPPKMQVELLRVLADGKVRPVGGETETQVDVRVVAASNKNLADLVKQGLFREDLFYRLSVVELRIPALRDRRSDIPLLAEHFLARHAESEGQPRRRLSREALKRLMAHPLPGNVRQLEHLLTNALVMSTGETIEAADLAIEGDGYVAPEGDTEEMDSEDVILEPPRSGPLPTNEAEWRAEERRRILEALEAAAWNRVKAAQKLGIPRRTFYRRLKEYGILE